MRVLFCLFAIFFLATFAPVGITPPDRPPPISLVSFTPVAPPTETGGNPGAAKLRFLAGWRIESNDWRFGGLSSLHVGGGQVLAFSDSGWMIRFPVPAGAGTSRAAIAALSGNSGRVQPKSSRDIESLAIHGSRAWLGLERRNGILRFALPQWRPDGDARPPIMRKWLANAGPEAMLRLPDGRFLVFSEGEDAVNDAALFLGDPSVPGTRAVKLRYRPPAGYLITDAAMLPDGRMLLLNRKLRLFGGVSTMLATAPVPTGKPGELIVATELGHPEPTGVLDNMEGLSVVEEEGRVVLWLASDNDFMPIRPTLLLKLALEG